MKIIRVTFAVLALLAATACNRSGQSVPPADSAAGGALASTEDLDHQPAHDPHAMTAIDVATGDLSGWASYAGDQAIPLAVGRTYPAYGQPAAATEPASDPLEGSVAATDEKVDERTGPDASPPVAEAAADGDQASSPSSASAIPGPAAR